MRDASDEVMDPVPEDESTLKPMGRESPRGHLVVMQTVQNRNILLQS